MAQVSTTAPSRPTEVKGEYPISFRVSPALREELDIVCQITGASHSVIFREGLALFCRENPEISDSTTKRVTEAVADMRARSNTGRLWPRQPNNGEG